MPPPPRVLPQVRRLVAPHASAAARLPRALRFQAPRTPAPPRIPPAGPPACGPHASATACPTRLCRPTSRRSDRHVARMPPSPDHRAPHASAAWRPAGRPRALVPRSARLPPAVIHREPAPMLRRVPTPMLHHTPLCMRMEALSVTVTDTECIHEFDLTFEDPRDAEDAFAGRDGYNFDGNRLRMEPADGGRGSGGPSHDCSSSFGGGGGGGRGHRGVSKHSDYHALPIGEYAAVALLAFFALLAWALPGNANGNLQESSELGD